MEQRADNRKNSIARNISYNTMITVMKYVFSAVCLMYVSRKLQPAASGEVDFATSTTAYFTMFATLGMPIYAIRCCARCRDDREKLSRVFTELFSLSLLLAAIVGGVFVALCFITDPFRGNRLLFLLLGSQILWNAIGCEWLYKGLERYRYLMTVSAAAYITALALILLAVHSPEDKLLYAGLSVLAGAITGICNFFCLRREVDLTLRLRINGKHLKPLFVFFAMSCMTSIYVNLDVVMLGLMRGNYETGLYGLVTKGKTMLAFFGGVLWSSMLPQMTNAWGSGDKERFRELTRRAVRLIVAVNLSLTVFSLIHAADCTVAMGGASYANAATAFRITILSVVPIGLSNVLGGLVMIPAGRERRLLAAEVAGAVVNFALNLYVIPRYSIEGAAVTTLIAEALVFVLCFVIDRREIGLPVADMLPDVRTILACGLAAVPACFVPLPAANVFLRLAVAAAVYFGSAVIFGLLLREPVVKEVFAKVTGHFSKAERPSG